MIKWIEFCVGLDSCSLRVYTCAMRENYIDLIIVSWWWHSKRESGKERVWEKGKKGKEGGKWFEGKERLFAFV